MKKIISIILLVCVFMLSLVGCSNNKMTNQDNNIEEPNKVISDSSSEDISNTPSDINPEEISNELYFTFDAHGLAGGMLAVTELSDEGSTVVNESVSWMFETTENEKIKNALQKTGIVAINPMLENDIFEGWIIFKENITVDPDGYETCSYEKISDEKLYSTTEIFEMDMPNHNLIFMAKWANIPMEEYSIEEITDKPLLDTCYFSLDANGGTMTFSDVETPNFELEKYNYWLNEGNSLKDTMTGSVVNSATLLSVQKAGARFTGWTVYEADLINWSSEEILEEGTKNFLYDQNDEAFRYIYLQNCSLYSENASTEEIKNISYNGKHYYAIANWE